MPRLGLRDSMEERADIDSQTGVEPSSEEHLARGPFDEHEVICRCSAVLRCIAAGRSAGVRGTMQVSRLRQDHPDHPGPRSGLVPTLCAVYSGPPACFSFAVFASCRSHRPSRIEPIARWESSKYRCMDSFALFEPSLAQADEHMRP